MGQTAHKLNRRAALFGGFSVFAFQPVTAKAAAECKAITERGDWSVTNQIHGIAGEVPLNPDDKLDLIQHIFYEDSQAAAETVTLKPYLSFTLSIGLDKDAKVTRSTIEVGGSGYAQPINSFNVLGGNNPDNPQYWPNWQQRGGPIIASTPMNEGDRVYIGFAGASGEPIVLGGILKIEKRNTMGSPVAFYNTTTEFTPIEADTASRLMRLLRGSSTVQVETGVVRASGSAIPLYQRALDTSDFDTLYSQGIQDLRAMEARTDPNDCLSEGCFLTTACCAVMGRPDDCFELATLRKFRDGWLSAQSGGPAAIAQYYRIAPQISQALADSFEGRARLRVLYFATILPCVAAARLGLNRLAYKLYQRMLRRLIT
ncbi:hypothetical protein FPY71_00470 [Aureimonas fodinaquatilis]|uniref:Uncharacterized protein n=1 Tax=Aureimonas fodinaquatilis TaxID=2565783 RepID=A0A5B0DZ36_9HYPH|nr:CFI-box-CTERM domain-containing protein [Aureimonas fodinaquatilis]KAA0971648.1 hypothetical protein FPY71_00470 [Aureimonas fodinaquatilis]